MGLSEFWEWIKSLQSKSFILIETESGTNSDVIVTKEKGGLTFELSYPNFKLLYRNDSRFVLEDNNFKVSLNNHLESYTDSFSERKCKAYIFETVDFQHKQLFYHQYHSKIDSDLGWFFFLEGR